MVDNLKTEKATRTYNIVPTVEHNNNNSLLLLDSWQLGLLNSYTNNTQISRQCRTELPSLGIGLAKTPYPGPLLSTTSHPPSLDYPSNALLVYPALSFDPMVSTPEPFSAISLYTLPSYVSRELNFRFFQFYTSSSLLELLVPCSSAILLVLSPDPSSTPMFGHDIPL